MAILTPDHLLEQATALLRLHPGRKPRQTEIRRAISAAYYAIFHFTLTKALTSSSAPDIGRTRNIHWPIAASIMVPCATSACW